MYVSAGARFPVAITVFRCSNREVGFTRSPSITIYKVHVNFIKKVMALTRAFVVRQQQRGQRGVVERDGDPGPLLDMHADVFIHAGFD